jgi:hypothetical protein
MRINYIKMRKSLAMVLGLGLGLSFPSYLGVCSDAQQEQAHAQVQRERKPIDLRQEGIRKGIDGWVCDYVDEAGKNLEHMNKAIDQLGVEKVRSPFRSIGFDYLSLAREEIDNPKKYDEEKRKVQCQKISKNFLSGLGQVLSDTPIDYSKEEIRDAWAEWVKLKTKFSSRLLTSEMDTEDYSQLVRKTFSPEEYRDFLEKEIGILNKVYDGFEASRTGIRGLFATDEINKDRKFLIKFCEKKAYEYYPEAKPRKEK